MAARALRAGYLRIGRIGGAAVRVHWSLPFGALLFTGLRVAPGAWLGFFLIVLVHEIGHAIAVVRGRLRPVAIDVTGVGGLCRFEGIPTPRRRVLIAWSGVLGQAAVLLAAAIAVLVLGRPAHPFAADLADALLRVNALVILVNLLPISPLDGAEAWGVIPLLAAARARRRMDAEAERSPPLPPSRPVEAIVAAPGRARQLLPPPIHEVEPEDLAPMPEEVRRVLDRVMAEGRAQYEAERKK